MQLELFPEIESDPIIDISLRLAFEAGRWLGQVDLEEHYDREQYAVAVAECLSTKKTAMPGHSESNGQTVTVNLRSDTWRAGVKKSAEEYLEKAKAQMVKRLNQRGVEYWIYSNK